jgi:hypothetical protein
VEEVLAHGTAELPVELRPIEIMVMGIPIHGDHLLQRRRITMGTQTLGDRHHQPKRITTVTQIHGDQARTNPNSVLTLIDLKAAAKRLFIVRKL